MCDWSIDMPQHYTDGLTRLESDSSKSLSPNVPVHLVCFRLCCGSRVALQVLLPQVKLGSRDRVNAGRAVGIAPRASRRSAPSNADE